MPVRLIIMTFLFGLSNVLAFREGAFEHAYWQQYFLPFYAIIFAWAFSWLLGQPIKDTLCGTKVLWRASYDLIAANRGYFGEFDPFGDFDLLFGAAKQNLKLVDVPVRYRERTYGETNIQRYQHGLLLFRMVAFAAGRIKFV